jgi:PAS domain S-box-containing protein
MGIGAKCKEDVIKRRRMVDKLRKINETLLNLRADHTWNVNLLTCLCGELLGGTCALYNRLSQGMLCAKGQWHTPADFKPEDEPEGHICYDVIRQGTDEVFVVRDLQSSKYAETDPNVAAYGLQTYLGKAVRCNGEHVGVLCVVFKEDVEPSEDNKQILSIIAAALGAEDERKGAEERITAIAKEWQTTFDSMADGVSVQNKDYEVINVNSALCNMLGRGKEELTGKKCYEIFHNTGEPLPGCPFEKAKGSRRKEDIEIFEPSLNAWFAVSVSPIPDERGEVARCVHVVRDITERKRMEEKMKESELKFRTIFDTAGDGILFADIETKKLVFGNNAICRMLGYNSEEIGTISMSDIHPKEELPKIMADFEKQAAEKIKITKDTAVKRKDGTIFYADINAAPITFGGKRYLMGIFRDTTEHKLAEQAQVRLSSILEATTDFVGFADARNTHILYINKAGRRMCGIGEDEDVTKLKIADVHPEWTKQMLLEKSIPAVLRDGVWTGECAFLHRDGREIPVLMVLMAHKSVNGEVEIFSTISRDITERKTAEARQAELLEKINSINKELQSFAYVVSHDLKAPLRGVDIIAECLATNYADKLDQEGKEQLDLLGKRVERMNSLIDGVLLYSRIGRISEEPVKVNLNELITEIIETIAPPPHITITIENQLPVVEFERTRIIQVFQNLLGNAVKYMDKPKGEVRTGCLDADDFWKFSVADNGPGIEEKHFERIFQLFQTLGSRDGVESTGIGLTIVKKIVETYGGKIWLESTLGKGTTFFFTLPKDSKKWFMGREELQTNKVN